MIFLHKLKHYHYLTIHALKYMQISLVDTQSHENENKYVYIYTEVPYMYIMSM